MTSGHPPLSDEPPRWPKSNIPVPDPSLLTTEQLLRELGNLRELLMKEINGLRATTEARFAAGDAAAELRLMEFKEIRPQSQRQIDHLKELMEEKFASVFRMFNERDIRTEQLQKAAKDALDAALAAAKELVQVQAISAQQAAEKAESSFTKTTDQISIRIASIQEAFDARFVELKERIDRGEGGSRGSSDAVMDQRAITAAERAKTGQNIALAVAVLLFISLIATVFLKVH